MPKNATRQALDKEDKTFRNRVSSKNNKQKLSPAERSQIAKDRWAKIKAAKVEKKPETPELEPIPATPVVIQSTVSQPSALVIPPTNPVEQDYEKIGVEEVHASIANIADNPPLSPVAPPVEAPAAQLAPAKPPRQKRTPVPKEFLVALKTADQRLAKAIEEYEDCQQRITYLSVAIPRLQRTVLALKNESNPDSIPSPVPYNPPAPYDLSGSFPKTQVYQSPLVPQPHNPLAAIQAAMDAAAVALPVSRATGSVQLIPDMLGSLEGPDDDDDEDRFLRGGGIVTEGKWIGG